MPAQTLPTPQVLGELAKIFNTALVTSRAQPSPDFSSELSELMESPELAAILNAVKNYAQNAQVSERQAAEAIATTFRKLDQIWSNYITQEGIERIQGSSL